MSKSPDHPTAADKITGNTVWVVSNGNNTPRLHTSEECAAKYADREPVEKPATAYPLAWSTWCGHCCPDLSENTPHIDNDGGMLP